MSERSFDALLVVSFGGPEAPEEVMPFLQRVAGGRVPPRRLAEVASHYARCGGRSPINELNRALLAALERELWERGLGLPGYLGNRNWRPLLADTLHRMSGDGVRRALAFVTSAYGSYSSCRRYREDLASARSEVGPWAPEVVPLRRFFNHPGFVAAWSERVGEALERLPVASRSAARLVFTAHSIPETMAAASSYRAELEETCRLVSAALGGGHRWQLVFQSRSGHSEERWLEPDVCDHLEALAAAERKRPLVLVPVGFLCDHMEVLYDLDVEAQDHAARLGLRMVRAATVGTHPMFVAAVADLVEERLHGRQPAAIGRLPAPPHRCPEGCCVSLPAARGR